MPGLHSIAFLNHLNSCVFIAQKETYSLVAPPLSMRPPVHSDDRCRGPQKKAGLADKILDSPAEARCRSSQQPCLETRNGRGCDHHQLLMPFACHFNPSPALRYRGKFKSVLAPACGQGCANMCTPHLRHVSFLSRRLLGVDPYYWPPNDHG